MTKRFITIQCKKCGICCSEPVVPVTDIDVKRLCSALSLTPEQIVRFYSVSEMDYDPKAPLWINFYYGKRAMGLKRRSSRCMFLNNNNLCSVYNFRPMTCRTFPYMVHFNNDKTVEIELNKIVKCKSVYLEDSSLKQVINNAKTEQSNDEAYYNRIKNWNRIGKGGTKGFLKFLFN